MDAIKIYSKERLLLKEIELDYQGDKYSCGCDSVRLGHGGWFRTKQRLIRCPYCNGLLKKE